MIGRIHSIQSLGTIDGPGIRFVAFLQGCNLRCGCCHNPDTWDCNTGTEITAEVSSADGGAIEFPLFAFDGYKAELDGREIAIARGDNNRIRVEIPAGTSGPLHIWFAGKLLWRVADLASLATVAALCVYVIRKRKNEFVG